uniref:Uncharacterized protein n=1 Tax=Arundo donax TaxID=35708 RepID=A0A0A8ZTJ6_ARUDO
MAWGLAASRVGRRRQAISREEEGSLVDPALPPIMAPP